MLIQRDTSLLLLVDLQEKLAPAIFESERVIRNSVRLLKAAQQLGVPGFIAEHCTGSIGPTVPEIRNATVSPIFSQKPIFPAPPSPASSICCAKLDARR